MANPIKWRPAWVFPQHVEDFIASQCRGFTVHVMNGRSKLGDLRIDMFTDETDVRGDAFALPLKDRCADTVVCDPPWGLDYRIRGRLLYELRRIIRPGGRLVFNAPWSPKLPGLPIESIYVPDRQLMSFHQLALVFVSRKIKGELPWDS